MLPLCHLRPCVAAMASLAEQFRSTLVLCTATQPSLGDLLHTYAPSCPVTELCPQTAEEYDSFRRMTFRQEGILEDDALAEKLSEHRRKASSPSSSGQNCRQCCSAQQSALRAKH